MLLVAERSGHELDATGVAAFKSAEEKAKLEAAAQEREEPPAQITN